MATAVSAAERRLHEAVFLARRRRVLRSQGGVALAAVAGLTAAVAAKHAAPAWFEPAVTGFVVATLGSLVAAWWTARRHWRCPACDVRWPAQETLASFTWNHCERCGAALRVHPVQRDAERIAFTRFAMEAPARDALDARLSSRRREGRMITIAGVLVGLALLHQVETRGLGELARHAAVAVIAGAVTGGTLWGARCPRCRTGLLRSRHCARCGLRLDAEADTRADADA